jgi:5-methylcytosine-specific restriction endonuclease McrA
VNNMQLSNGIIEHKFINVVPATLQTSGYAISAHYLGVASMFNIISQKKCMKCGGLKSTSEFHVDKATKSGFASYCKKCKAEYRKEYYYPVERKKNLSRMREWRLQNLELARERERNQYQKDAEKRKAGVKRYRQENPEKVAEFARNRRARVIANGGKITKEEWLNLCNKYGNRCLCCGRSDVKLTLDHVVPITKGGSHTIDNAQPLCHSCNSHKRTKTIDYRKDK